MHEEVNELTGLLIPDKASSILEFDVIRLAFIYMRKSSASIIMVEDVAGIRNSTASVVGFIKPPVRKDQLMLLVPSLAQNRLWP